MNPSLSPAPSLDPYVVAPRLRIAIDVALDGLAVLDALPVDAALAAIRKERAR